MSQSGHLPGHIRATFVAAFVDWKGGAPEPNVELSYEPYHIPISRACGLVWNCSDTIPGNVFDQLRGCGLHPPTADLCGLRPGGADCDQEEAGFNDGLKWVP